MLLVAAPLLAGVAAGASFELARRPAPAGPVAIAAPAPRLAERTAALDELWERLSQRVAALTPARR
jgi:hypothetical protein